MPCPLVLLLLSMRLISALIPLLFLCILGWVSFGPADSAGAPHVEAQWRRTRVGWEKKEDWHRPVPGTCKSLHPLTLGAFQLVACVTALVAFSNDRLAR